MALRSKILTDKRLAKYRIQEAQDYLQVSITILLITIFIAFAIRPSLVTAIRLNRSIKEYKDLDEKLSQKIVNLRTARSTYNEISTYIPLLDKALPLKPNEGNLLTNINFIGAKNNVQLTGIHFNYTHEESIGSLNMSMTITGKYENILGFLTDLNNLLRIVTVESLNMSPEEELGSGVTEVSLIAKSFYEINQE